MRGVLLGAAAHIQGGTRRPPKQLAPLEHAPLPVNDDADCIVLQDILRSMAPFSIYLRRASLWLTSITGHHGPSH